jgi:hypothetical protein
MPVSAAPVNRCAVLGVIRAVLANKCSRQLYPFLQSIVKAYSYNYEPIGHSSGINFTPPLVPCLTTYFPNLIGANTN